MGTKNRSIFLNALAKGTPGISKTVGACLAEAGAVCLDSRGHSSGVELKVVGCFSGTYSVHWQSVTDQMRRSWNDLEVTTENGAYCVAVLLILELTDYTVIERSRKGTGFDYWLGKNGSLLFQDKARLEVSGIGKGDDNDINTRVNKKIMQTNRSDGMGLPAYVVVVEFSSPLSRVEKK